MLHGMWDLPRPGIEPVSPALAGGFLTTAPPGNSLEQLFEKLGVSSGGDRSTEKFGAVETGDLTQVSTGSLWLQHGEQYWHKGGDRKTREKDTPIVCVSVLVAGPGWWPWRWEMWLDSGLVF